ncbi:hypothetical protein RI196_10275 [Aeribacillus composti]|uniref:Phage protein n=1 Tax=Aeribacillus composti TaxID=1868734 RepID=A0ABY9W866_9BACI|nr:hypothetical protein [Aeribacillus composti]WNF31694.1 hypothetical protein RI196_10275 [Aeribacillus composti]
MNYFVIFKGSFGGCTFKKFETLDEAKESVKELYEIGCREVYMSQEVPMKVTVEF